MILLQNTEQRYGAVALALHWLMAAVLVALLAMGLYMASLPDVGFDTRKIALILYHKQLGLLALMLAALRLAWRVGSALPSLVPGPRRSPQVAGLCADRLHLGSRRGGAA
ncbi:MAG TPA: cytochrome b/b6 domain-containing protein, partial [Burkholderiaceae bacterium]|nr:cytochrome b/b6 domain-containing protein [Burkholderiaceae bacterium]